MKRYLFFRSIIVHSYFPGFPYAGLFTSQYSDITLIISLNFRFSLNILFSVNAKQIAPVVSFLFLAVCITSFALSKYSKIEHILSSFRVIDSFRIFRIIPSFSFEVFLYSCFSLFGKFSFSSFSKLSYCAFINSISCIKFALVYI